MRIHSWPTSTIVGAILISLCQVGPVAGKCPIVFGAKPVKDSILPFEKAFIWLKGLNDGDTAVFINSLSFYHMTVVAVNLDSGDTIRCPTGDVCWGGLDTSSDRHLSPGQTHVGYGLLIGPRFENSADHPRDSRTGFSPWPKGTIRAELRYWPDPWRNSLTGPCAMLYDTVVFVVAEESPQDSVVLDEFCVARSRYDPGARMDSLWSVIIRHGDSRYASLAAYDLAIGLNTLSPPPRLATPKELCVALAQHEPYEGNIAVAIVGLLGSVRPRIRREITAEILSFVPELSAVRRLLEINFDPLGRRRGRRQW